ncbi:MGA, MAX dimerization protein [Chelydra serpentina]|uniref:MAX gene-associated protein n=1 Tax=Chelydra serpentina TaxID=8475 RepID=A0A8T1T2A5_CHESE|nr:MGA, MAX dimerization protein [Chelydra serpentina]
MEKQQIVLGNRDSGTVSGAAPAFFVILKQQQGNGKADQGILVANRDACTLASSVSTPVKSKIKTCLPADCTSGSITVTLDNNSMWNEFYHRSTEMILTKQGRRMFPYCRYWITGLDSNLKYILVMDISPVDNHRYKWNGRWWEPSGKAEPHVLGRVFIHPESPSTGQYWMHQPVSFYKLKLTNNTLDQEGHIILHSMHRYLPRLHLVPADKATEVIQLNGPDVHTFTFPQTEFFAVTAYQNIQITQLKIDYNPFAKGFRDDGLNSRPQRDLKQNSSSEHEGGSVSSSPSNRGHHTETDGLESQQRDLDSSFSGQNPSDIDLEKESFNAERDFLDFLDADLPRCDMPRLKQEVSESPIASSYESSSWVASPLDPSGHFNVVIKEEPVDDYDYGSSVCTEGITVKQEDTDEETDEYSNSSDDPILEKQLRKHSEMGRKDAGIRSTKRMLANPSGVAKAKMLKLDSGKMPVVYLEPCAVTKSTVKISELPQTMLSSCKKDKSPVSAILDSLPICFENHKDSCLDTVMETEEVDVKKQFSGNKVPQKYCSIKEAPWTISKSSSFKLGSATGGPFSAKDVAGRKKAGVLRNPMSQKGTGTNQHPVSSGPSRRGRPRKLKISKAGRPPKNIGKNASLGSGSILPDVKPDLEDVDGVLFVSFASKEALDIHTVDRVGGEESQNLQTSLLATSDPGYRARIRLLEKELLEDLKSLRHKQVIHPSLQEVGLKLNSVDPTMSIDLKYLGVQLPLSYSKNYSLWSYPRVNPGCSDAGFPFVSRTGKTNDFTKIKGWRGKFHGASRNEGSGSEGSLKNRSAFCSDKLDEYLENEGKLMETSMGFSSSTSTSPVVYQLPTKSTSYVRTLDSVLKKQSTSTPSTSYTFKPLSVSSASRKMKTQNKQTASKSRVKPSYKPILPSPVVLKQKHSFSVPGEKVTKSLPSSNMPNQVDNFMVPALDENMLPKQISLRQAHQQQQATRPPGLSKSQVKLMDLEDCALWDGKPRTYITEERADISLATLLTAQASLKNKPIHKIIRRRAPPCNNDFCRLGCVCASLALEKRQPTHCRRPDCMFGCTCLKRRVLLVKGGSKHKKILKKAVRGSLVFYGPQGEEQQEEEELEEEGDGKEDELKQKDRRRKKKVEYTICDTEPEQPIRNCPLWIKVEGEIDPEPIYIPTPSVIEPMKPLVLPTPEVLPSSKNKSSNGVKPGRVYTPKPNPVIRDEDKDPVYLYFERMMTCARVRAYECKREGKKQQKDPYICNSNNCTEKEHDPEHQTLKKELCEMEKDTDKSGEESWWSSRSEGESSSTSYVRHTTPGGPTKLIEIISDCNWEEDRNKILSILSQHINSNMPQSLKVGSFIIELASEHKSRDEKNPPIYSSRVKISMPSCQDKGEKPEMPVLEIPDSAVSSCKISENIKFLRADTLDKLREKLQWGKGLPFYTGLSPAGKLVAYKRKANLNPSGLIQVNGKSYPQAKLLLGLMGALHPANRLAAYITGRLQPTVLDLSTLSTVISKVASNAKAAASGTPSVQVPTTSTPQTTSSISTTSTPTVTTLKAHVPAQRQIAARPSPGGVFTQFVMSKVGALQQKIPGVSTPQPLTGPQKFNVRPTPIMVVTPVVPSRPSPVSCTVSPPITAATTTSPVTLESVTTVASSTVTTTGHTRANESTHSPPGIAITGAPGTSEISACTTVSPTTPTATVNITKATGMTTPVATISFPKSVVTTPTINHTVLTTSSSPIVVTTTAVTSMVTTPTSSVGSVPIMLSGINTSPSLNPRPEDGSSQTTTASPQGLSSGTEKRVGPRLLLIPVHQGSPALRPLHNVQLTQGHRMILQPLRSPGGVNLFRHPNGQIIQLVPLHQLRAAGTQSNIQPVMFRNPGSVVGIRLPGPSKPPETPVSPTSSTSVTSVSPAKNPAVRTVGSKSAPAANLVTQASSILPSVPSFVSQAGTLTLRISPPGASSIAGQTGSESKITYSSGGQPTNAAGLIPLQSGSFALLQLPGQKSVPNSILHHVASLQIKKDSQNVSQKDESSPIKQQEPEKASHSEDVEVMESEVTVSDSKQEENELPANQSNSTDESAADVIISDRNSTASEMAEKDPEMLEDYSDDIPTFQHDVSADVISSDHSYISEKPISEKNKVITEKNGDSVHSEEVLEDVSDNSGTISELLGQAVVAPATTAYPESPREQEETAMLKNHVEEYTSTVQAESSDTEQAGNAEPQKKGEEKVNAAQSQSPQEKQEIYAQLESKDKQQEGTQTLQNQKELQDSSAQPEDKRKEREDSIETENIMEEQENKSEIIYTKEHDDNSGKMPVESTDKCKRNLDIQEKLNTPNQEQGTTGFQKASENAKDNSIHVNSSWNTISSKTTDLDNKSNTERENKVEKSVKGYFLTPEQRSQEPKLHKKGYTPTVDITIDDVEEEEEDDDEKTDDSADETLDGASDFQSEEEVDVEKLPRVSHSSVPDGLSLLSEDTTGGSALLNDCEYSENDEPVDIETVEELSEKINIARLKATASSIGSSKQKHRIRNPSDEKMADKSTKKPQFWNRKQKNEAAAFAHYRQTHTANERRRRNEMRDLFEKLKRALGLHSLPKVSKCYILKQAYEEIQGLTDQADKLIGQKNLLTRKQDILIRKVSTLSGKTEEVVLKKLEYIYAKQKAVEAQKKRKQVEPEELVVSTKPSRQQEESSTSSKELEQMIVTNRRGKPLILARKGGQATVETTSSPITLTTASLVMTPQGQVLTLKSPLMPGQVAAVPSTLLQAELKPQVASNTVTTQPGIASVMIQLPGSTVPVQVKGILTNSAIPITLSTIASNPVPPAVGTAAESASENEDSFMMPKIVNVTSLAAEGGVNLNLNRNKNSHVTPGSGAQTSELSMKAGPHESRRNEDILSEEKNKASPGNSCGNERSATGPTQIFLENKDNSFPQIRNIPNVKDSSESFAKKSCIGEFLGSQGRRKETDQGGEKLKPKESPFRKLQVKDLKDSRIEMELRKVASAIEEAELDPSELLGSIEESDDTDETLTSLLNEIAFLNQQLNDDTSGMSELPSTLSSDFSPEDSETRRGTASDLTTAAGASFQFGHLGSSLKGLSEVRESSGSISPLLLHLEDDDLTDGERNSAEPSSQADILKIVIGSEMKDPLANLSVTGGGSSKTLDPLSETNVSPPILQMKTNLEAGNTDTLWRPMPKLAPLGLKIANLPLDSEGQSTKVMPVLAPVVAKLAPVGLKTKLPATDLEGQDSKIMPTLASVVAKLNSIGTLPSNSAGK